MEHYRGPFCLALFKRAYILFASAVPRAFSSKASTNAIRLTLHPPTKWGGFQAYVTEPAYCCTRNGTSVTCPLAVRTFRPARVHSPTWFAYILAFMPRTPARNILTAPVFIVLASAFLYAPFAYAWGNEGHRIINRLAASNLPADVPAFLRSEGAINEIEYLGPEPDRWRSAGEPELNAAQAPEHFIDLEPADALGPLPRRRLDFEAAVFASGQRPERIGLQPWEAIEVWERLKAALREYRQLSAAHQDTHAVEEAAIFYAGWLGHYVGDASQPLHTTVQYNGWTGPNPNGYTTAHTIHWQFEGTFVGANLHAGDVQATHDPGACH